MMLRKRSKNFDHDCAVVENANMQKILRSRELIYHGENRKRLKHFPQIQCVKSIIILLKFWL